MTSPIDLCNQALQEASARGSIQSFSENSSEAGAARTFYEAVRNQALRAARWNFARSAKLLTLLKAAPGTAENPAVASGPWTPAWPKPPWVYEYAFPSDAVAFWQVLRNGNASVGGVPIFSTPVSSGAWAPFADERPQVRFEVASDNDAGGQPVRVVLTSAQRAIGVYTRIIEDPNLWDATFREIMVQALAGKFAAAVSGKMDVARMRIQNANNMILAARVADGNEGSGTVWDSDADWIRARGAPAMGAIPGYAWGAYGPLFAGV